MIDRSEMTLETAVCVHTELAVDLHGTGSPDAAIRKIHRDTVHCATNTQELSSDILPFAAEKYKISGNFRDYIAVPVAIMASDLPNRNLVAFPFGRLTEFHPDLGMLNYQSWKGKPTYINHKNQDITQARGLVLDVGLKPISKVEGSLWRVDALCLFDRKKDPKTVNKILSKECASYSMGCYCQGYYCSICGTHAQRPTNPMCDHIPANRGEMRKYQIKGLPTLAYWNVGPFQGFEVSALEDGQPGAFPSTDNTTQVLIG